jgi:hypothetical protein
MNDSDIVLNHVRVLIRVIFRNSLIDYSSIKYVRKPEYCIIDIFVDSKNIKILYSTNSKLESLDLAAIDLVFTFNTHLDKGFNFLPVKLVKNRDSSVRWILPSHFKIANIFNVYTTSLYKKVLLFCFLKLPFLKNILLNDCYINVPHSGSILDKMNDFDVIYGGISGAHHKVVIFNSKAEYEYTKLPIGSLARQSLQCEVGALEKMSNSLLSLNIPKFRQIGNGLSVSKLHGHIDLKAKFSKLHYQFQQTMTKINFQKNNTQLFDQAKKFYSNPEPGYCLDSLNQLHGVAHRLSNLVIIDVSTSFSHGDFTPWNIVSGQSKLYVFDWEMFLEDAPLYFDVFHYIYYSSVLVDRIDFDNILNRIEWIYSEYYADLDRNVFLRYHLLYVYIQSFRHLKSILCSNEEPVPQASWLVNIWISSLIYFDQHRSSL